MLHNRHIVTAGVLVFLFLSISLAQSVSPLSKTFDQQGLTFEYASDWDISGQPTGDVQQLVLIEKALDAQIMVIVPRSLITSAVKKRHNPVSRRTNDKEISQAVRRCWNCN